MIQYCPILYVHDIEQAIKFYTTVFEADDIHTRQFTSEGVTAKLILNHIIVLIFMPNEPIAKTSHLSLYMKNTEALRNRAREFACQITDTQIIDPFCHIWELTNIPITHLTTSSFQNSFNMQLSVISYFKNKFRHYQKKYLRTVQDYNDLVDKYNELYETLESNKIN